MTGTLAHLAPDTSTATTTKELAALTGFAEDADDARMITLLADLADARAHDRPRVPGLLPELEQQPYQRFVIARMASQTDDQPGWILALRLNALIDRAIELGIGTWLAQRLALAVSHRPDGENAAEHEDANDTGVGDRASS